EYYEKKYNVRSEPQSSFRNELDLSKQKLNIPIGRMRLSPHGNQLAYSLNDHGRVRVQLYDMHTGQKQMLFRYGIRNFEQEADLIYPSLAWKKEGGELSMVYENKDVIYLKTFKFDSSKSVTDKISPEYQRIYDVDYWSPDTLLLAAATDGLSDLYLYIPSTRESIRLTEDFYDDLDASVVTTHGQHYVLFSSNRPDETLRKMELDSLLPVGAFDLFLLSYPADNGGLRKITFTSNESERQARIAGEDKLICLTDKNGRWQRMEVSRLLDDPPVNTIITRYDRDILQHEYVPNSPVVIDWLEKYNLPYFQTSPVDSTQLFYGSASDAPAILLIDNAPIEPKEENHEDEVTDPGLLFQTKFPQPPVTKTSTIIVTKPDAENIPVSMDSLINVDVGNWIRPSGAKGLGYKPGDLVPFVKSRVIASRLKFKLDYLNTTMDNDLLFGGLDSYAGTKREFEPSPLGLLIKGSVKDLLEDYIITGGARFPTTFNGSEYFLVFNNRKRRIDKEYALYRKSLIAPDPTETNTLHRNQYVTALGLIKYSYPFDVYNSARLTATFRNDRIIALATDISTLAKKTDDAQRLGLKLEWVYDNTRILDINSRLGTRAKAWVEVVKRFDLNLFESGPKLQFNKGFMTVLGFDTRHYVSPDRRTIFAFRFTGATSIGSERILYYLGGVENWLFPSFDQGVSVPNDVVFAYTGLAANMRGFRYNARNGSSVALTNTEIRIPILQYLSRQKIRSSFLRNIQLVGFLDAGTAWHGPNPFSPQNPLNTVVLKNPPTVEVTINYYRNPLIVGYGAGVRTILFGYLLKLDYGWNWETKTNRKPILHFSMGADF
ncbi:MAG: hypothetical protein ABIQ02_08350, partial [Saprospiraceae bacterium]